MHDARYRQPEALLDHGQKCFPADLLDRQLDRLFGSAQHPPENSCEFAPGTIGADKKDFVANVLPGEPRSRRELVYG